MPRIPLQINFQTPEDTIFSICGKAGLKGKEANEVYHSLDAVKVWRNRFADLYGDLLNCVHHSNPDDPPDLTLNFINKTIEVEHTRLQPPHYGWMDHLHLKQCPDHSTTVPSVSLRPRSSEELLSAMLPMEGKWSDMHAETHEWFRLCFDLIRKKIEHRPEGVLVIQNTSLHFEGILRAVVKEIHELLSPRSQLIQNWTILLHSRSNHIQYDSYLITAREDLQHRSNDFP